MEKIPWPVLANILTIVGSFPEILRLLLVCKKWKSIIEGAYHYVTFQGARSFQLTPWEIVIYTSLRKFREGWKLTSLDLRNVNCRAENLAKIIVSNPEMLKLDLSNSFCDLVSLWEETLKEMEISNQKNHKLEELRLTNVKGSEPIRETLAICFPNLAKLYIGNTSTSWESIKILICSLQKLKILDISYCFCADGLNLKELEESLSRTSLRAVYLDACDIEVLNIFKRKHIEIINRNIESLLNQIKSIADLELLEIFLKNGGDVNLLSTHQNSPQKDFIMRNSDEELICKAFQLMIRYNLDLYQNNNTYINSSIGKQLKKLFEILLRCGADIWPNYGSHHEHPIVLATKSNDPSILQLFINYNYQKQDNYLGRTCNPICSAASEENWKMFAYLANNSVPYFRCPCHKNILFTDSECFDTLLNSYCYLFTLEMLYEAAQVYVRHLNNKRASMLIEIIAARQGHISEKSILANLSIIKFGKEIRLPLMVIAAESRALRILYKLTEKGFDVSMGDNTGITALMSASIKGYPDVINFLCLCGAPVNQKDFSGKTALHHAAKNNQVEAIKELIKSGAVINSISNDGFTPLDLSIRDSTSVLKHLGAFNGVRVQVAEPDNKDPYSFF
ncbi:unnamed protein product [Blepharisma stoltei]|uniref:F-box domain-containing protein n=1 Tax=Blepharisma stoltei TaxID=1481888 RepID=A0AAU9K773_9CILI|nr:unnamed protein product [Blepharisma stoltei]